MVGAEGPGRAAPACFRVRGLWREPGKRACCLLLGRLTGDECSSAWVWGPLRRLLTSPCPSLITDTCNFCIQPCVLMKEKTDSLHKPFCRVCVCVPKWSQDRRGELSLQAYHYVNILLPNILVKFKLICFFGTSLVLKPSHWLHRGLREELPSGLTEEGWASRPP